MSGAVATAKPQTLDELMLAMDVVDTIRHRDLLVARELGQGERDDALRNRLREIYKSQGIEVTDAIIDQGIKALRESRFVYAPPAPGLGRTLALIWVRRAAIVGWTGALLIAIGALWGGYHYGVVAPAERAAETARIELAETLPKALADANAAVMAEARIDAARAQAEGLRRDGQAALAARNPDGARTAIAGLEALRTKLVQTYQLRIVAEGTTGFFRIPNVNESARNYYIVVEAIDPAGRALTLPVTNEEDSRTYNVTAWGVRVPQDVFEAVARDKRDNGIIENRILGDKQRGELDPRYRMSVLGGAVTSWEE
ncbi:MAG: hypothetical protein KBA31_20885 [Alphaproteobacteria bacterium]|nr:hypothetical protein [Alphaproteobacteria bacterium]